MIASSSRCRARFSGRWTLQPIAPRTRQRWPGWIRNPASRSSAAAIRGRVHRSVRKPCAWAPCGNVRSSQARCAAVSLAGRPSGRRFHACPPFPSRACHLHTVAGVTPSRRDTSACVTPSVSSSMPRFRRRSIAAKSRRVVVAMTDESIA